ncbi:MAG TPA: hypothetical protein VKY26_06485 [Actinomycetota bacterium]|nr:hypothetical protein [Actinomycetota bacterium]
MPAATVKVTRRWGGFVMSRPFPVSIDGTPVDTIAPKETKEFPVDPGHHVLQMGAGRHISPKRSFDVGEGDVASFWCRGAMLWPVYLAALVKPDLWITLKEGF